MLLNQETLRLVFGLKLRGLRLDKGYSLKELSKKTGLSPSYLNEIEKGKKYPKTEKILLLAHALEEKMENLVSLELKKELQLIQQLLDKKFLGGLPFDIFGIPTGTIFELLAEHPKKMQALVGTLIEIARAHNIEVDDLFFALLRSYLDMHKNHFPTLEESANNARTEFSINWQDAHEVLRDKLKQTLENHFKVTVQIQMNLKDIAAELAGVDHFILNKGKQLFISNSLSLAEQIFVLSRELGYQFLKIKVRPVSSLTMHLDSFEQLFNFFSASYFASSLLIPEKIIKKDLQDFFANKTWSQAGFMDLAEKFACPIESFFHRMTQMLPRHLGIGNLFFLRYEYDDISNKYQVERELHLSSLHAPHKVKAQEHYCSRWLVHRLTQQKIKSLKNPTSQIGIQRSSFVDSQHEYLILAASFKKDTHSRKVACVCLGLLNNEILKKKIGFLEDSQIPKFDVGETCERCTLENCSDRQAPLDPDVSPQKFHRIFEKIQQLDDKS